MKNLFYLLICLGISANVFSQTAANETVNIPKDASVIYVHPVSFDSIVSELQKQKYKIDNLVENRIIVTKYKMFGDFFKAISLHIRYYDSTAEIMGTIYSRQNSASADYVVTYSSFSKKAFEAMNKLAIALNAEIRYEK